MCDENINQNPQSVLSRPFDSTAPVLVLTMLSDICTLMMSIISKVTTSSPKAKKVICIYFMSLKASVRFNQSACQMVECRLNRPPPTHLSSELRSCVQQFL